MTGILAELRRGPRTTSQLMAATGLSKNAVECSIRRADRHGHEIVNTRVRGGQHEALYWLTYDRDNPGVRRCAAPGCGTVLSHSNGTRWCRRHLPAVAAVLYLEAMLDEVEHEQLELAGVG